MIDSNCLQRTLQSLTSKFEALWLARVSWFGFSLIHLVCNLKIQTQIHREAKFSSRLNERFACNPFVLERFFGHLPLTQAYDLVITHLVYNLSVQFKCVSADLRRVPFTQWLALDDSQTERLKKPQNFWVRSLQNAERCQLSLIAL